MTQATVVHLLALPFPDGVDGAAQGLELTRAAPYFRPLDTEVVVLGQERATLAGEDVTVTREVFEREILVLEVRWHLEDALAEDAPARRSAMQDAVRSYAGVAGPDEQQFEEYVALCVRVPAPADFVAANGARLATFLREEAAEISREEASQILASRVRYSDRDLAIVDWDGALLVDADGDFASELALLKLGNTQLLRYRLLDRRLDDMLAAVRARLARERSVVSRRRALRTALETRLDLLLDYEAVEQRLALIGDWYTADLYRVIVDEFYVDEWRAAVHAKLETLHDVAESANANLAMSWQQLVDLAQLIGWAVLLVGYFVLFALEFGRR